MMTIFPRSAILGPLQRGGDWVLVLCFAILSGCASGRAMTETELAEYERLAKTKSELSAETMSMRRQVQTAFKKSSVRLSRNAALSCGDKNSSFETGKVPLVFGAKKRLRFQKTRASKLKGCHQLKVDVKP